MKNTTENHQAALARREDLVVQEMPDEVLVYDLRRHKAHCLNKTAAFVWEHCDGQTTIAEMTGLLQQEVGSPVDEEVVWYALDKLKKADLLAGAVPAPVNTSISRRRLIKRFGVGAAMAIPTVISLVAPTVAQGQTVVVAPFKIAVGTCTSPPGPLPPPGCLTGETCCTSSSPAQQRICLRSGGSSGCTGQMCVPAGNASDCN